MLLLLLRGSVLLSHAWSNAGAVILGRTLAIALDEDASRCAVQAETMFHQATAYDAENHSAWRGLGFALAAQGREDEALTVWRNTSDTDQMSTIAMTWGFSLVAQGREGQVWSWYERAMEPGMGDAWYDLGLAYEKSQPYQALEAYKRATEAEVFDRVGRSSSYYRMGIVYQRLVEPSQLGAALTAYETAIAVDDFTTGLEEAACHYARGEVLWWTHGDPDDYIAAFQRAIELNPDHVSAHVLLGVAHYTRYQDVAMAEAELRKAMALDPHYRWPYFYLGDIYQKSGRSEEAIAMYEQALAVDPFFEAARQRLYALEEGE